MELEYLPINPLTIHVYGEQSCNEMEAMFHENLRLTPDEKMEQLQQSEGIFLVNGGLLVGETMGANVDSALELDSDIPDIANYDPINTFYVYTTGILPSYRNRGLTFHLRWRLHRQIMWASQVIGHAREGAMMRAVESLGGKAQKDYRNYFDCGYDAFLYEIPLTGKLQEKDYDCGPAALRTLIQRKYPKAEHGRYSELVKLCKTTLEDGTSPDSLVEAAERLGYTPIYSKDYHLANLLMGRLPAIANVFVPDENDGHYVVVLGISSYYVVMFDPACGMVYQSIEEFLSNWYSPRYYNQWFMTIK